MLMNITYKYNVTPVILFKVSHKSGGSNAATDLWRNVSQFFYNVVKTKRWYMYQCILLNIAELIR